MTECCICQETVDVPQRLMCSQCGGMWCRECHDAMVATGRTVACPCCRSDKANTVQLGKPLIDPRTNKKKRKTPTCRACLREGHTSRSRQCEFHPLNPNWRTVGTPDYLHGTPLAIIRRQCGAVESDFIYCYPTPPPTLWERARWFLGL